METIVVQLDRAFRAAIVKAFNFEAEPQIGPSQNEKFGDYQSNAAMGLVRQVAQATGQKANPRSIAQQIVANLDLGSIAQEVRIDGPGFINVRLSPAWLAQQLRDIGTDPRLGVAKSSNPQRVVVDYSGPNIAKELHVGHLRSTIIGDALVRLLQFQGHDVIRQNHTGDWGTQFGMLIAMMRAQGGESVHIEDLEAFYVQAKKRFDQDPAFQDEARQTVVRLQSGKPEELAHWRQIVDETRRHYQPLYDQLGVLLKPEDERGESFYNPMLADVVRELRDKGIAKESAEPVPDQEEDEMGGGATAAAEPNRPDRRIVIFTEGYESPLVIQKTDGGYLYATTDLAAIKYRINELHATRLVYTHDSRQTQRFAQLFDAARRAGWAPAEVRMEFAPFGTMLGEDGRPFRTKHGGTVKLKLLLDEAEERALAVVTEKNPSLSPEQRTSIAHAVGIGSVKYADLSKDRTSDYVFSWDKMLALDGNTAPYLQNAHVRVKGIFRKAAAAGIDVGSFDYAALKFDSPFETALAKHILRLGEVIELAARELRPHYLCTYLYELAMKYHAFFENCPVMQSEGPTRASRLALCELVARALAAGLDLLGIEHPDVM